MELSEVSRVFRSTFPEAERSDFRTRSWRRPEASQGAAPAPLEPLHPTLLHAFAFAARMEEKIGVTLVPEDEDERVQHRSYRWLYDRAKIVAAALEAAGLRRGERVLLVLPTSFELIACFFAVQRLSCVPVPSYPPAMLEKAEVALGRLAHVAERAGASYCITNRQLLPLLGDLARGAPRLREILVAEKLFSHRAATVRKAHARGHDPAFIQYTSGSTGSPKGVLLPHSSLVANLQAAGQALQINRNDSVVSWLPLYHDMGLIGGLLWGIYWRLPVTLLSPTAFLLRPVRWLRAIQEQRGTLTVAPNFGYALCVKRVRAADRAGLDLSSLRAALNGAEPVNLRTVREFTAAFAPHGFRPEAMLPVYGLAEATVAVTFPTPGEPLRSQSVDRARLAAGAVVPAEGEKATTLACVGKPVPGHEVQIVDAAGRAAAGAGEVGHVIVRGPSLMQGYYLDPKATHAVLRGGWLWTGDLGYFGEGGLYIAGRAKDLIIVRGKNHYAEDVEHIAERVEGVRPGGAVAFAVYDEERATDCVVLVCETKVTSDEERTALAEAVSERVSLECGLSLDEVELVPPGTLPKTSSGKRQRGKSRELYLRGELEPASTGKLRLALVFARSGAGFIRLLQRRLRRREPD